MLLEKMNLPACPYTIKEFSSKNGQYCLKTDSIVPVDRGPRSLKLYKKEIVDGLDTYRLVAQKHEKEYGSIVKISKNLFNKAGELIEKSHIILDKFHSNTEIDKFHNNKEIVVQGKSFHMDRPLSFGIYARNNKDLKISMGFENGISPMVKRVLKLIANMK